MVDSYKATTSPLGETGIRELTPWIRRRFSHEVIRTDDPQIAKFLQLRLGDVLTFGPSGNPVILEVKTEEKWTGNLFLETWSNKRIGRKGWLYTMNAMWIAFYFRDKKRVVEGPFIRLKNWAINEQHLREYREVEQKKHEQGNDTWGAIVPVSHVTSKYGILAVHENVTLEPSP